MIARTDVSAPWAKALALVLASVLLVVLAGCADQDEGSADAPRSTSATEHNEADVAFASEMLQHHAQALSMVDLTLDRPLEPEVRDVAEQIRAAQAPEIETFSDWLTDWDEEVPETMRDHSNAGHDMGDMGESMEGIDTSMPGMLSAEDMASLEDAPDSEFEDLWLERMIEHHAGAIQMARTETEQGRFEPAVDLAGDIVETQTVELELMERLLGS